MQEIKHILFVPHSPEQPINAVILSKKLSKAATALGISNHVATSVEHLDLSNVIDTVVFVGQKSAEADQLRQTFSPNAILSASLSKNLKFTLTQVVQAFV